MPQYVLFMLCYSEAIQWLLQLILLALLKITLQLVIVGNRMIS